MANKENQHYIPQFYLRNFSNNDDRKSIGIYNRKNNIFSDSTSIKNQASKKHFYGKDEVIENFFAKYEGAWASVLTKITKRGIIVRKNSIEYAQLLTFISTMAMRTPTAIDLLMNQLIIGDEIIAGKHPSNVKLEIGKREAIAESFRMSSRVMKCIKDLDYKVIKNNTNIPFITSDHPLVKYNKLYISKQLKISKTGYSTIGLILFLPLSSNTLLALYDSGAYNIGPKKKSIFNVSNVKDIHLLNTLQFSNQKGQIYFCNKIEEKQISLYDKETLNKHNANNPDVNGIDEISPNNIVSTLLIFSSSEIQENLNFDWLSITYEARKLNLVDGKSYIRKNSSLADL
ncbi:MAG: DUF4238 domain-containing protein [Bacteroidia bacterium]|nr:DUF4238 domain-containing protein [Bacteroidia bacterium]